MKKRSSRPLLALCLALFSTALFCQEKVDQTIEDIKSGIIESPEKRAADLDQMMKTGLQLTDGQAPAVHEINLRYANRTEAEVVRPKLGSWSRYWKMMSLQREKDAELKLVLTKDQFKKYAAARDAAVWKGVKAILF